MAANEDEFGAATEANTADDDNVPEEMENLALEEAAYERFKSIVLAFGSDQEYDPILFKYSSIRPQKLGKGGVHTIKCTKLYKPCLKGAVIGNDYSVIPFGFSP
jgi:hypothetical protein